MIDSSSEITYDQHGCRLVINRRNGSWYVDRLDAPDGQSFICPIPIPRPTAAKAIERWDSKFYHDRLKPLNPEYDITYRSRHGDKPYKHVRREDYEFLSETRLLSDRQLSDLVLNMKIDELVWLIKGPIAEIKRIK